MKILKLLDEKLEEVFLVIILITAVVIVAMQVVTRYVFKIPLPWSEEIARYLFLWLTWVGASYATKERKHVSIDLVYEKLPEKGQMICKVITNIIWLVFLLMMVRLSMKLTLSVASGGQTATSSGIPMWIPYASIPTGMGLMAFRLIQNCYKDVKAYTEKKREANVNGN